MNAARSSITISADPSRVILRPLNPVGSERQLRVIARVLALSESDVTALLKDVNSEFSERHRSLGEFLRLRFEAVRHLLPTDGILSEDRKLLMGAYFTQEYSIEAAALFNPSIVIHPDQTGLRAGGIRFVLSLRATGEGHISSVTFRSGTALRDGTIEIDPPNRFATVPIEVRHSIDKRIFGRRLEELGIAQLGADSILAALPDSFSVAQLTLELNSLRRHPRHRPSDYDRVLTLAKANYEVTFDPQQPLSERVLFPTGPLESQGMEDARFVRFVDEGSQVTYFATYTAYDGRDVRPQLIQTKDFLSFRVSTLNGSEIQNKGMALFPRRIHGRYTMISRQDAESLFLMYSDDIHTWEAKVPLMKPTQPWEFVQIGNCGSPLETPEGWLVISHGVGPMRKYSLGAFLLDLNDPSVVLARLKEPLLEPNDKEREGYVPNVLYTCGALIHAGQLILPYAMSDIACSFATIPVDALLSQMERV